MTRASFEKVVRRWQSRLRLNHWDLVIDTETPAAGDAIAECIRHHSYDTAVMRFRPDWPQWERRYANDTIVHELLHLQERDLSEAVNTAQLFFHPEAWKQFNDRCEHEREGLVDRLATILVDLGGEV
jgi:hypothetical protein